ncbi:MAG: hypothetical protein HN531_10550 [Opitutae bacterium]|jgi:hypothetical protein|nr:hypothetical protein [Opitutae bacterium]
MHKKTNFYESNGNSMATLEREEEPEISNPNENLSDDPKNPGIPFPLDSKNKPVSETQLWLDYVSRLDPDDESGAFLTPADLKAVDEAYARLQLSDSGIPNSPGNQARVASSADDEFIKRKMATAIERAQIVASDLQLPFALESLQARKSIRVNVLNYQRGSISGKCIVLLPKGETIEKNFTKETGWKAEVEIFSGEEKTTQTIFARGICMNVITGEAIRQKRQEVTYDYSGIEFEPMGKPQKTMKIIPIAESVGYEDQMEPSEKEGFLTKLGKFLRT